MHGNKWGERTTACLAGLKTQKWIDRCTCWEKHECKHNAYNRWDNGSGTIATKVVLWVTQSARVEELVAVIVGDMVSEDESCRDANNQHKKHYV